MTAAKPGKQPTDRKVADAAKAEAVPDGPIEFDWRGKHFIIEPDFKDDVEILEDIEDDKVVNAVRRILGAEQWGEWKEANRGPNGRVQLTVARDFIGDLFEELGQGN